MDSNIFSNLNRNLVLMSVNLDYLNQISYLTRVEVIFYVML